MTKTTTPDTADLLARTLQREEDANRAAFRHLRRIEALERALDEIIMEATSRNHAIDIARRARAEGGE
jgi:hypothetical protein